MVNGLVVQAFPLWSFSGYCRSYYFEFKRWERITN